MKMVKSLLLGSAAGLVAVAGAQAADLPVKAKPVQYVKICSLYGVGFYYIPGTDMCLKVGGWARQEIGYGYNGSFTTEWYTSDQNNRSTSDYHYRYKGVISVDSRNQTEYGTVRSYVAIGTSNNFSVNEAAGLYAPRWFIQWAGFTFGHSTSFYDYYSVGASQYGFVTASSDTGDGGWDVLAYTAQLGNGMSASISAELQRRTKIINGGSAAVAAGTAVSVGAAASQISTSSESTNYQGSDYPDIVGNLRVEQAWGSAQIMGALHEVDASYYSGAALAPGEGAGHPGRETGFVVGAGIKLNAPMIGKGDFFQAEVDYTEGALRYLNMTAVTWDYAMYHGNRFGFGLQADGVYGGTSAAGTAVGNASSLELTSAWAVNAAYTHYWNPAWKTSVWGSYEEVNYNDRANAMICASSGAGTGFGTTAVATAGCDMDWSAWGVGVRTQWNITSDFYLGLEVLYSNLNSASTPGGVINLAANGNKPAGTYTIDDQENWAVRFRAHKDFYP